MVVKAKNLKEITGKESGILLFDNGDVIICDWSDMDNQGIPNCLAVSKFVLMLSSEMKVTRNQS